MSTKPKAPAKWKAHANIKLALKKGLSVTQIAESSGVPRSTLREYMNKHADLRALRSLRKAPPGPEVDVSETVSTEEILAAENKELKSALKKARTTDVQSERVFQTIEAAVKSAAPKYIAPAPQVATKGSHVQALLLSDIHAGEVVDPEAVDYANEYNWEIMERRMTLIAEGLLSHRAHNVDQIDELQIWMLGDMCSGENHLELAITNEIPIAEQSWKLGMLLGQFIEELVPHYPSIKVHGVVGNHPRVQVKPANKQVYNNFDWMCYNVAGLYLKNYESVECEFPHSGGYVVDVAGLKIYLFHGDGIRSSMPGVPWGGVTRRVNEITKQYAARGVFLDGFALGHFHQANAVSGNVWMNGSVKGTDEYCIKNFGRGEAPRQLLVNFSKKRSRVTGIHYIDLDDEN